VIDVIIIAAGFGLAAYVSRGGAAAAARMLARRGRAAG
jgi:hypothetical protein